MNILVICLMIITPKVATALTVNINENKTGIVGIYKLQINCSFTKENVYTIFSIGLFGKNVTQLDFVSLVSFLPGMEARLTTTGNYLSGRVMLTNLTQESTEIKLTFTRLECIDEKEYRCKVTYQKKNPDESDDEWSSTTSIKLTVRPSKPEMFFTAHPLSNTSRLDNETDSMTKEKKRSTQLISNKDINETAFMEGDNITFLCTGNVGNPEGIFVWQKIYSSEQTFNYSHVSTESIHESCSYNGTSNLTIQMTANDNKAKIRCIVQSETPGVSVYTDSEPLQIYFKVREPLILVEPNVSVYKTGESVQLNCKADGNPNPHYSWFKGNISDTFISDNDTLVIANANISDSGLYTCDTSNEINGEIFSEFKSRKVRIVKDPSTVNINPNITKHEHSNGIMLKCSFNISAGASFHSIALAAQNKTTGEFKDVVGTYNDGKSISTAFGVFLFGNVTAVLKHNSVFMLNFNKLTFKHERLYKCILVVRPLDDLLNTNSIESGIMQITVTADDSNTPSSGRSLCSSGPVIGGVAGALVFMIVIVIVIVYIRKKTSEKPKSFVDSKPKPVTESRTGDYDYIALGDDASKTISVNNGLEIEDIREHNKEYLKKQEEEEQKKNESNTSFQPAVYAQVNEATKSKNKQNKETLVSVDQQEDDTYAETQEGIYDISGDRRHKINENDEHFDTATNLSTQNSNDDTKSSKQNSQIRSYNNQAFEKVENRKVATVSPTMRSSAGLQEDEQTNQNRKSHPKCGYENVMGKDQTDTSDGDTSHPTSL